MNNQSHYFEIKDIMTQFISAFDDVVINRYNRARETRDRIKVKYVYAPKGRVLEDLINKSQHLTLPVISISQSGISRDSTRVFDKLHESHHIAKRVSADLPPGQEMLPSPVPINISVNMSILTKYQSDMEQILQNFIVYSNPYIIISWKLPETLLSAVHEIRSEVLWSGDVAIQYPYDISSNQPARVTADTTFTIKGWLFPYRPDTTSAPIYEIETTWTPVELIDLTPGYDKSL